MTRAYRGRANLDPPATLGWWLQAIALIAAVIGLLWFALILGGVQ